MDLESATALADRLREAFKADPSFPSGLEEVAPRFLMNEHLPVVKLRSGEETLCFIVHPTDPAARVYKRTKSFDITYFSEDVPDAEQSRIYQRDKAKIERFVAWLTAWDR